MLDNSGTQIRWTADENMIMNGLIKDHRQSREHLCQIIPKIVVNIESSASLVRGVLGRAKQVSTRRKSSATNLMPLSSRSLVAIKERMKFLGWLTRDCCVLRQRSLHQWFRTMVVPVLLKVCVEARSIGMPRLDGNFKGASNPVLRSSNLMSRLVLMSWANSFHA